MVAAIMSIDVIVPTASTPNPCLIKTLSNMKNVASAYIVKNNCLSVARKNAVLKAQTEWVGMVDDDMLLPSDWAERMIKEIKPEVGVVASVAVSNNKHVAAYDRVVNAVVKLNKVDTAPHINNVIVRRKIMEKYNPPRLFFGEDQFFKHFVEQSGYVWKVLPFFGVTHLGESKNFVVSGEVYRRYGHFSFFQLVRRMVARFLFTPLAAVANLSFQTFLYLTKRNVEFIAGWMKEN
jgi:glycosyltransferase involved in cell wall biosynthesis